MTLVLDPPIIHGTLKIAVLCKLQIQVTPMGKGVVAQGGKTPVAVLIAGEKDLAIFAPDGSPMTVDDIEALSPGVCASFAQR